jgi:hypothetical protein
MMSLMPGRVLKKWQIEIQMGFTPGQTIVNHGKPKKLKIMLSLLLKPGMWFILVLTGT